MLSSANLACNLYSSSATGDWVYHMIDKEICICILIICASLLSPPGPSSHPPLPWQLRLGSTGLFLGTIYSVPPLRLKRFAVPAFLIIATVRGFLLNFGVYSATRAALGLEFQWSPAIL